jgi:hypothetical protein
VNRLLSPNEAKFWLLDAGAPMNCVVVIRRAGTDEIAMPQRFSLPIAECTGKARPRWVEGIAPGVLERRREAAANDWLTVAQELLDIRVGTVGVPPWHAVELRGAAHTTLLLAVNHAVTDWRTALTVGHAFLEDRHPGAMAPACEEMLPESFYGDPDAAALIDGWWSPRAAARWEAVGIERLISILPPATPTRFAVHRFDAEATGRLNLRCEDEGASLNAVLAVATRDVMGIDSVAHAVGLERFIRPAPPEGPGLAVSHVFTKLDRGEFWESARQSRDTLFQEIRNGAAGDALLPLPKFLLKPDTPPSYEKATMTITGAPTANVKARPDGIEMELVLSSARGGGNILVLSHDGDCLQLIAGTSAGQPEVPLAAIAERIAHA